MPAAIHQPNTLWCVAQTDLRGVRHAHSDKDNDTYGENCATTYSGSPWWYTSCWSGNINGGGVGGNGYKNAAYWAGSAGSDGTPNGQGGGNGWIYIR